MRKCEGYGGDWSLLNIIFTKGKIPFDNPKKKDKD